MCNASVRIQTTKLEQKMINQTMDHLIAELDDHPKASTDRTDRIALIKTLVEYQHALRGEEMAARRTLFMELRPKSAPIDVLREPTLAELQAIDWDDLDRENASVQAEIAQTARRRQQLLRRLAGQGSLKNMLALIAKHRGKAHGRLELWPMEGIRDLPPSTSQLISTAA
jgi:hypothetical protein